MTFSPIIPSGGIAGWRFLQRTLSQQQDIHSRSPQHARAVEHFRSEISNITTTVQLVEDRLLREVALTAHGLADDIDNKFFIREVLRQGLSAPDSLANRLSDPRYASLSKSFGFGGGGPPRTIAPGFSAGIISKYHDQRFEEAVGEVDPNIRLALGLERELSSVIDRAQSNDARWFSILGSPPLRKVFEGALQFPSSFARLDIDSQLERIKEKADAVFGTHSIKELSSSEMVDQLRERFLLLSNDTQDQMQNNATLRPFRSQTSATTILSISYS